MTDDVILTQAAHDQLVGLVEQLIEISIWQDAEAKAKDPIKKHRGKLHDKQIKTYPKYLKK